MGQFGKKILLLILCAAIAATMLYMESQRRDNERYFAKQLHEEQETITRLEQEKKGLLEGLTDTNQIDSVEVHKPEITLCVVNITDEMFNDFYPILKENGIKGVLVLRNHRLPGDNKMISVKSFVEMLHDGWECAVSLMEESEQSQTWEAELKAYLKEVKERTSATPTAYRENSTITQYQRELLEENGMKKVLTSQKSDNAEDLLLMPYRAIEQSTLKSKQNRYCAAEIYCGNGKNEDKKTQYAPKRFQDFLEQEDFAIKSVEELKPIRIEEKHNSEENSQTTDRLIEIDKEIRYLYGYQEKN